MGGLGYGGYAVLQNIQRVGLAPLPEAPDVIAVAPEIPALGAGEPADAPPSASDYFGNGALAAVYAPEERGAPLYRDGPISAIDPKEYGVYAGAGTQVAPRISEADARDRAGRAPAHRQRRRRDPPGRARAEIASLPISSAMAARLAELKAEAKEAPDSTPEARAASPCRRRARPGSACATPIARSSAKGILAPGERYVLPERVIRGTLHAGNAGDDLSARRRRALWPARPARRGGEEPVPRARGCPPRASPEADPATVLVAGGRGCAQRAAAD